MKIGKSFTSLLVFATAGCSLAFAQVTNTFSYTGPSLPILYDANNAPTLMQLQVPVAIKISTITTTISVNYPFAPDLNVYLFGPDGTRTKLAERNCTSIPQATLVNITFSDSGAQRWATVCPQQSGGPTYQGNEPLSNYSGKISSGTWTLAVENNGSNSRVGTVDAFSVTINGSALATPTISAVGSAAAAQAVYAISPGEFIGVQGFNIGPTPAVLAPAGASLPTTLGGVQVTINGQAIPLYYVSADLIGAIVPYQQSIPNSPPLLGGQVTVQVSYGGATSNGLVQNLTSSTPAVFTRTNDVNTVFGARAINIADGTVNSPTNPAAVGSYVALYAQGLGPVQPAGFQAGSTAPNTPLYTTTAQMFVSIGGQTGPVSFSGLAPATIGAYQVNFQVPPGTPSGQESLYLYNSAGHSQDNVFIWIK
jgi:uncharacterized protein (TIGR03437 family)